MIGLRDSRRIALFMLFSFLSTPVAECGAAVCSYYSQAQSEINKTPEEAPHLDPQAEAIRKAWLKKFGDKWSLDESAEAEIVCTCTCCGDRCPMGAACCCLAPKYPVMDRGMGCFRGPGCQTSPEDSPIPPVSIAWFYLLPENMADAFDPSRIESAAPSNRDSIWKPLPDSPPPELTR